VRCCLYCLVLLDVMLVFVACQPPAPPLPPPAPLDVRFISSLPVMQGNVYKAWVDSKPVQMVRAGD